MIQSKFVYREAQSAAELNSLVQLRYNVFRSSRYAGVTTEHVSGLDLNCFDLRSKHYGLFLVDGQNQTPVSYQRIIHDSISPHAEWVMEMAAPFPDMQKRVLEAPSMPFPFLDYFKDDNGIADSFIANSKKRGEQLGEASRISLHPDYRQLSITRMIIESALAAGINSGFSHFVTCCYEAHTKFYSQYGFQRIEGLPLFQSCGSTSNALIVPRQIFWLPEYDRVLKMYEAINQFGSIYHDPDHPGIFTPSTELTGDMSSASSVA